MSKIIALGETVYDIIFESGSPKTGNSGGSMLNTSISLGRLGLPVFFVSEVGNDILGKQTIDFISANNVNANFIKMYDGHKTAIALAHLDENKKASYTFYKDYPTERFKFEMPRVEKNDIVLFGSSLALNNSLGGTMLAFAKDAHEKGAILIYDPNYRPSSLRNKEADLLKIHSFIPYISIFKGSDEDFFHLWGISDSKTAYEKLKEFGDPCLIYTKGENGCELAIDVFTLKVDAIPVKKLISTVGAGDNFTAGVIYALFHVHNQNYRLALQKNASHILKVASTFASQVCASSENCISLSFAKKFSLP